MLGVQPKGSAIAVISIKRSSVYQVYIIECTAKTQRVTVHVGIAKDVPKRVQDHQNGKVKATRGRQIKCLGYSGSMSHREALQLEIRLKKLTPAQKRAWASTK